MAHITITQLNTILSRIVTWATGKFAAKNTHSGKLEYSDMPVVVLASMGPELDGTDTQRPMSAGSTYFLPAEQGVGARIMFATSGGQTVKISDPVSGVIYCNAYTDLLYRWDVSEAEMVPVGGTADGDIDVSGKADMLAGTNMLTPTQWPKVILRNITDTMLDDLASDDVYFDSGHLYLYKGENQNPVDLGAPNSKTIYYCLADGKFYRWHGNSFQAATTFDNAPTQNSNNPVQSGGVYTALAAKQDTLVSGTNIKTVNNTSLLGGGNISIQDGVVPHIGTNGNWWVGDENDNSNDTGIKAQGTKGDTIVGASTTIVNNVTDGGETSALSAEMGKVLRTNLMAIFNALGEYAFPSGKPTLNWGSTVVKHSITATLTNLTASSISVNSESAQSLPAQVNDGESLSFTLTLPSNLYVIDDDNLAITMSGDDIKSTAFNPSTGVISIASVTGDLVIMANSITYKSADLVFHLDCKNRGGQNGHWIDLIGNKDFTLNQVVEADTGLTFDGVHSTAHHSGSLAVGYTTGSIEFVMEPTNSISNQATILFNGYAEGLIACGTNATGATTTFVGLTTAYSANSTTNKLIVPLTGFPAAASLNISNNGRCALVNGEIAESSLGDFYYGVRNGRNGIMTVGCFVDDSGSSTVPMPVQAMTIKAIRVYSSQLTLAQAQHNYKVDKKRFNLS